MMRAPDRLHFTGDDEADALLAREPLALLIGAPCGRSARM